MERVGERLRRRLGSGGVIVAPDAHDPLVARLAVDVGFEALYMGSLGVSVSGYGVPDQSLLGIAQLIERLRLITAVVDVPVCIDLEDGGGNAVTTARNVREAEAAGAAAIQIEDHVPGKNYGAGGSLHPVDVAAEKIRAAVEARRDPSTVIIGRTETLFLGGTEDEAVQRAVAYAEAGADMITISLLPTARTAQVKADLGRPLAGFVFGENVQELNDCGVDLALYAGHSLVTHYAATRNWLERLHDEGVSHRGDAIMSALQAINHVVAADANNELARRHNVI